MGKHLICQQFVSESEGRDVRVHVVGGRAVGAIERFSEIGDFRASIDNGASHRAHRLTPDEERMAIAACDGRRAPPTASSPASGLTHRSASEDEMLWAPDQVAGAFNDLRRALFQALS